MSGPSQQWLKPAQLLPSGTLLWLPAGITNQPGTPLTPEPQPAALELLEALQRDSARIPGLAGPLASVPWGERRERKEREKERENEREGGVRTVALRSPS